MLERDRAKGYRPLFGYKHVICYSVVFDESSACGEKLRYLSDIPLELVLSSEYLVNLGIIDVTEPLSDAGVRVAAVKIAEGLGIIGDESFEKALILADEVGAEYVVVPVNEGNFESTVNALNRVFHSAVTYAKKVVLEPSKEVLPQLSELVSEFLGGVFKYSLSPTPSLTTGEMLKLSLANFGRLAAVKLVCFARDGRATRVTSAASLNVFTIIKGLIERGYDGLFVLDYEPRGLVLPARHVREDYDLLLQFARSIAEKRR
ncbi:MAG: hypothetical protein QXN94_02750 [Thermofilaceae archaeon]